MRYYLEIEIEGDALAEGGPVVLAEMIRDAADDVERDKLEIGAYPIRDPNGNTCGVHGFAASREHTE